MRTLGTVFTSFLSGYVPVGGFDVGPLEPKRKEVKTVPVIVERAHRAIVRGTMARGVRENQGEANDFGVDAGLIDANLRLPVQERMQRHFERVRMYQRMQERTLTERERAALRKAEVDEAIRHWGRAVPT